MTLPDVTIIMTTYFPPNDDGLRLLTARRTLASWDQNLRYQGNVHLHIGDDGSFSGYDALARTFGGNPVTSSQQHHHGVGASLNHGMWVAFQHSPIFLYAVDDWQLTQPFDLTPWVDFLMERDDAGMVRLGPPHPGTRGEIVMARTGWLLKLEPYGFAFGHRPALYHKRLIDHYGFFEEDCSALECERLYNENFAQKAAGGPGIFLALPHPWRHLESIELGDVEPANERPG